MAVAKTVDFLAHLAAAEALHATVVRTTPRKKELSNPSQLSDITQKEAFRRKEIARLEMQLGKELNEQAKRALRNRTTGKAWKRLISSVNKVAEDWENDSGVNPITMGLGEAFFLHWDDIITKLDMDTVTDKTLPLRIGDLLLPIVAAGFEKARRFWYPVNHQKEFTFPLVEVHDVGMSRGNSKWWDADLRTQLSTDKTRILIPWVRPSSKRKYKRLLRWYFRLSLVLTHEAFHFLCPRGELREQFKGNHALHGWIFFLNVADAIERASKRKDHAAIEFLNYSALSELVNTPARKIFGNEEQRIAGWKAAGKVYKRFKHLEDMLDAKEDAERCACPYYRCPLGLDAYAAFHVLTRLNLGTDLFPGTCGSPRRSFGGLDLRLCLPLQLFMRFPQQTLPPSIATAIKNSLPI